MLANGPPFRLLPRLDDSNRFFWTSGSDGQLRFLRCRDCQLYVHPPSPRCPQCLADDVAPEVVSGRVRLDSYTVNDQKWIPGAEPYIIGLVSIAEQPDVRLTTNICDIDRDMAIGMEVEVIFEHSDDVWLPLFRPARTGEPSSDGAGGPPSRRPSSPASASRPWAGGSVAPTSISPSRRPWWPSPTPASPATTSTVSPPIPAWGWGRRASPDHRPGGPRCPPAPAQLARRRGRGARADACRHRRLPGGGRRPGPPRPRLPHRQRVDAPRARAVAGLGMGGAAGVGGGSPRFSRVLAVVPPLRCRLGGELAGPRRPAPDPRLRTHPGAAGPDRAERSAQRGAQPQRPSTPSR